MSKPSKSVYRKRRLMLLVVIVLIISALCFVINSVSNVITTAAEASKEVEKESADAAAKAKADKITSYNTENAAGAIETPSQAAITQQRSAVFGNAVFIGDSRTEGLLFYERLAGVTQYTAENMTLSDIFNTPLISIVDEEFTIKEMIEEGKRFDRFYIMMGFSDLDLEFSNTFVEKYEKLIDLIESSQPDAEIYVQSILPVTEEKSLEKPAIDNQRILEYNVLLKALAEKKNVTYVDVAALYKDEDGNLNDGISIDGVHINKRNSDPWLQCLMDATTKAHQKALVLE